MCPPPPLADGAVGWAYQVTGRDGDIEELASPGVLKSMRKQGDDAMDEDSEVHPACMLSYGRGTLAPRSS